MSERDLIRHISVRKVSNAAFQRCSIYMKQTEDTFQALQKSPRLVQSKPWVLQSSPCIGYLVAETARDLEGPTVSRYPKVVTCSARAIGVLDCSDFIGRQIPWPKKDGGLHEISKRASQKKH